jgi:uncharacterized RDD family membrane protein YckC
MMATRADFGTRLFAFLIDGFILGLLGGALTFSGREFGSILSFLIGFAYCWFFWTRMNGQTLGKMLMKIRVVKEDGSPLNDADAVVRYVGYTLNTLIMMLGWLWALWDSNQQGWHDKLAKTIVVKA